MCHRREICFISYFLISHFSEQQCNVNMSKCIHFRQFLAVTKTVFLSTMKIFLERQVSRFLREPYKMQLSLQFCISNTYPY